MDDDDEYDEYEQNTQTKKRSCYERLKSSHHVYLIT